MFERSGSQVVSYAADGVSDKRYLATLGHIGALTYSYSMPGGPENMTCNLMQPPLQRFTALNPGRVVRIYRGASAVWEGIMNEPVPSPTGWALQADGNGRAGDRFMAKYTTYTTPGDPVNQAITRGMPWVNPYASGTFPGSLYVSQPPDDASETITAYMNNITSPAGYLWYIGRHNLISVFAIPVNPVPTRILYVTVPVARTLAGYFTQLWLRYQKTAQSTSGGAAVFATTSVTNQAQATKHGVRETYADLSSAGTKSAAAAQGIGNQIMAKYQAANYAGQFTIQPGQLRNAGGAPIDLGTEQAGTVVKLVVAAGGYGGDIAPSPPITFLTGSYQYNDETGLADMTPWLAVADNLATLLQNYVTLHQPGVVLS